MTQALIRPDWKSRLRHNSSLYSDEAQRIAARNYYRPRTASVLGSDSPFLATRVFVVEQTLRGWLETQSAHFAIGGTGDRMYALAR